MGFDDISYFIELHQNNSLRELLDADEEETRILHDIMGYDDYADNKDSFFNHFLAN